MKKLKKLAITILLVLSMASFNTSAAFAAPLINGAYWCHMKTSLYNGSTVYTCCLKVSSSNVSGNWAGTYNGATLSENAIDLWNDHSQALVEIEHTNFATANVDLITYKGTIDEWEEAAPSNGQAFTILSDKSGNRYTGGFGEGGVSASEFGSRINYACVIFNPSSTGVAANNENTPKLNLIKTITHEIGHCINLAHPSSADGQDAYLQPSVMCTIWETTWNSYPAPTPFDLRLIRNIYTQIYS